jgi:hypothetical protein
VNLLKTILTRALLALSLLAPTLRAEEVHSVMTALSSTTLTGYVDTSAIWGTGAAPVRPVNDDFTNASPVELGRIFLPADLASASLESGEPSVEKQTGSVWFRWTVPQSGLVRLSYKEILPYPNPTALSFGPALSDESVFYPWGGISYDGSNGNGDNNGGGAVIETQIGFEPIFRRFSFAAYRGGSLQTLSLIQRGVDLEFQAAAGETIWVAFETFENHDGPLILGSLPGQFWLDLTPVPSNDSFDAALTVSETAGGSFTGHFVGATRQENEPDLGADFSGPSVWFGFTASVHGPVTLNGSTGLPIAVFTSSDLQNLQLVAKGNTTLTFRGELGKRYHIAVYAGPAAIRSFGISYTAPRYRLYTTTVDQLMPPGLQPHFYGVRGSTMLFYAKTATSWDCVEIEPIVNFSTDLLIRPNAVDGELRVITIDETLPAPRVQLRAARNMLIPDIAGYPGQTCAISYSTDLVNWSAPQIHTLSSDPLSLAAISPGAPTHFFRITQSLPQPTSPPVVFQPQQPATGTQTGAGSGALVQFQNGPPRNVPPPPLPRF